MTEKLSDEKTAQFIQAAIISLRKDVVPALADPSARIHADLITRVLYMLHGRFSRRADDLQQLIAECGAILADIDALLPESTQAAAGVEDDSHFSAIDKLEAELFREELRLADRLPSLLARAATDPAAAALVRRVVAAQREFLVAQDPDIVKGSFVCYQGGRIDEERLLEVAPASGKPLDEANLAAYVQKRFPGATMEKFSLMAGGFSKTTIFFTLVEPSGEKRAMVIRKDLPVDFVSSVAYEFPLIKALYDARFPVAKPLWLEDDPALFGGRFMVSERVSGSTDVSRWAGDPQAVEKFARQLAKLMAELHAIPLDRLGYGPEICAKSAGELMRVELDRWGRIFKTRRKAVFPLQEISQSWLQANIPQTLFARRASLVHGDIGFHNLMIDEGRVSALLDWEFSHPGDPIEDLIYTKPFIEKVMDWQTFKSFYVEYGGITCTEEEEFFYTVWSKCRNPASCMLAADVFTEAPLNDVKFAASGFILGQYLQLEAGQMIADALSAEKR